ncbi:hypothetical protein [Paenarthrobacter sp. Y-19]|uniref:hypothetical protein n=1 Tax=Paenarthrobacter sp. Y-19 TaxID=3031125 RepID=UPI0023DCD94D|nr:hypothetical protein [Paenarthrobacter sp. Y-19]
MSNEHTESQGNEFAKDPDGYTHEDLVAQDYILEMMLVAAMGEGDDSDTEFSLTLVIDGVTVTGTAISAKAWAKGVAGQMGEAKQAAAEFEDFVAGIYTAKSTEADRRAESGLRVPPMNFVHMRDAVVGNGLGAYPVPLWRGSLRKLSGWTLGRITRADNKQ